MPPEKRNKSLPGIVHAGGHPNTWGWRCAHADIRTLEPVRVLRVAATERICLQSRRSRRSWVNPNEEATTTNEGKSVRSLRVGSARGVCGVARLGRGINHAHGRAPCLRSLAEPTRLTWNTQTGSQGRSRF